MLVVVDAAGLNVAGYVNVGFDPGYMVYNRRHNKLYCATDDGIFAVDCANLQAHGPVPGITRPHALVLDTVADRLYCSSMYGEDWISVVDCRTDSALLRFNLGDFSGPMVWNPAGRRVYVAADIQSMILVLRDTTVTGIVSLPTTGRDPARATIARGVLWLRGLGTRSESPGSNSVMSRAVLLDAIGRKVLDLLPGPNDVRHLSPGVYFVREHSALSGRHSVRDASGVTKVVIAR